LYVRLFNYWLNDLVKHDIDEQHFKDYISNKVEVIDDLAIIIRDRLKELIK